MLCIELKKVVGLGFWNPCDLLDPREKLISQIQHLLKLHKHAYDSRTFLKTFIYVA